MWNLPERSTGVFSDKAALEPLVPDAALLVGSPSIAQSQPLKVWTETGEVIRICANGDVLWKCRLVESDEDFKKAMMEMAETMKATYTKGVIL